MNFKNTLVAAVLTQQTDDRVPAGWSMLLATAAKFGVEVTRFCGGRGWQNFYHTKIGSLYTETKNLSGYDYIVFVDAHDTLFCTGLEEMHKAFTRQCRPFVISGEHHCWPWPKKYSAVNPLGGSHRFRHPNSGFYMAEWGAYLKTMQTIIDMPDDGYQEDGRTIKNDDQAAFYRAYMEQSALCLNMGVDYTCELSQALAALEVGMTEKGKDLAWGVRPVNRTYGTRPCALHANGAEKWRLKPLHDWIIHERP